MNGRQKRIKRAERARNTPPSPELRIKLGPCRGCGEMGVKHFVPPCLGDIGFYSCNPPDDIVNHTRDRSGTVVP